MSITAGEQFCTLTIPTPRLSTRAAMQGKREIRGAIRYRPHDLLEPEHLVLPLEHDRP